MNKKKKTVCDKQLADEVQKLLEKNDVDDTVVTEVVAKINGGDDVVDADGEKVAPEQVPAELDDDEEIDVDAKDAEDEDNEVDLDSEEEVEDEDDVEEVPEVDEEVTDEDEEIADVPEEEDEEVTDEDEDLENEVDEGEENIDEEVEDEDDLEETSEKNLDEEAEDEDLEEDGDVDEEEEIEDADEENAPADPFAKLRDPIFADGFNRGYAFAIGLMKMGKLGEFGQDEAVEEEEKEEEVEEKPAATINPAVVKKDEEKRVLATDSMAAIKAQVAKEYSDRMNAKIQASQKVQPLVGKIKDVMAFDSAESIYKFALEQNGVNVKKYKPSAYEGMIDIMVEKHNNVDVPVVVNDAKPFEGFSENLSQAIARLKKINSK